MKKGIKSLCVLMILLGLILCDNAFIYAAETTASKVVDWEEMGIDVEDSEDPLNGRANGYVDDDFFDDAYGIATYSTGSEGLVHNSRFDGTTHRVGIDVSSHNGSIDWNAVKASGVEFAFIRLSYRAYASGTLAADTKGMANLRAASNAGLDVGVYIFSQAINTAEAIEEADYICNQLNGFSIALPVVMDYEYVSGNTGRLYNAGLTRQQATENVNAFCNRVVQRGYSPMLYANKSFLNNSVDASAISNNYKVWLANYTNCTDYSGDYTFWQYTSEGSVSGINGNVDCDIWYDPGASTGINYSTHIQDIGWQRYMSSGEVAGTTGQSKRLEAIIINETSNPNLGVMYRTHIQDYGWESTWRTDGQVSGTSGQSKRLEAIQIMLTGSDAPNYDIYYTTHLENCGWMKWAKNGEISGSSGFGYRLEAIKIVIIPKGNPAPSEISSVPMSHIANSILYNTHVQDYGWQSFVGGGAISGTTGQSKRLEGIKIQLNGAEYSGGIAYRTHIQDYGWENGWKYNGEMSGTSGQSKRLEAIQICLTGDMANYYNVYYRVHCENYGWLGWARNGQSAGSAGCSYRLEAIQIVLVPKGGCAPGSTANCFVQR